MGDGPAADRFLPSVERARAADVSLVTRVWWRRSGIDLFARDPVREERVAALLLLADRALDAPRVDPSSVPGPIRYAYVPSHLPFQLEEGLTRLLEPSAWQPPEALRFDVDAGSRGDPYRGLPSGEPEFHGHRFGDALGQVRGVVQSYRRAHGEAHASVRVYAWPVLFLTYSGLTLHRRVALLVHPEMHLHALIA